MTQEKDHIYFPNLNGLRFFAAFMVLYAHIKFFKHLCGVNKYKFPIDSEWGELGVTLFFVLSGFLITYLLLHEYQRFGTIKLKFFYMRRVLRIFPLYFLTVFLSFFVLPYFLKIPHFSEYNPIFPNDANVDLFPSTDDYFYKKLFLFSIFLPNLSFVIYDLVPFGSQLWSVGVEEQFYLFWPTLVLFFRKRLFPVLLILATILVILPLYVLPRFSETVYPSLIILKKFLYFFRIDCMAIGGIMAYLLFTKRAFFLNLVYNKISQWIILVLVLYGLLFNITLTTFHNQVYSVFFGLLILNLASNKNAVVNLEHPILKYLGKISYGLYIYNPLAIILSINVCNLVFSEETIAYNIVLVVSCIMLTIGLSSLSYHFFEEKFLKLKPKFSKVLSN